MEIEIEIWNRSADQIDHYLLHWQKWSNDRFTIEYCGLFNHPMDADKLGERLCKLQSVLKREKILQDESLGTPDQAFHQEALIQKKLQQLLAFRKLYLLYHFIGLHTESLSQWKSVLDQFFIECKQREVFLSAPFSKVFQRANWSLTFLV
jgi:hypothetical protein